MAIDLSTIKSGVRMKAPKIALYGVGGIGKTTFAAAAPKPIFCFTEEGQGVLDVARFEPDGDPCIRSWAQIIECCQVLYTEEHDFQTFVLDSIDFAEPLLHQYTAQKAGHEHIEDFGYGKGYTKALDEARILLQWLDALRNHKGMAIIVIAHCETRKFEDPEQETYDTYDFRLHKTLAAYLDFWSDAVLFAQYKTHTVKEDAGFNKTRTRAAGVGQRVLYTQKKPAFRAKNRYGLPPEIPLSWQAFIDGMPSQKSAPQPQPQPQTTEE